MYSQAIESKTIKVVLSVFGVILTPIAIFIAAHGIILGYGGFQKFDLLLISMGIATILGVLGLGGAWFRLFKKLSSMSRNQIAVIRTLLFGGVVSGLYLVIGCIYSGMPVSITLLCLGLTIGGIYFVLATPKGF